MYGWSLDLVVYVCGKCWMEHVVTLCMLVLTVKHWVLPDMAGAGTGTGTPLCMAMTTSHLAPGLVVYDLNTKTHAGECVVMLDHQTPGLMVYGLWDTLYCCPNYQENANGGSPPFLIAISGNGTNRMCILHSQCRLGLFTNHNQ